MRDDREPLNEKSRSQIRSKRRKTNVILNSLIVIVLLLIVIVSINIFFGNDDSTNANSQNPKSESSQLTKKSEPASSDGHSDKQAGLEKDDENQETTSKNGDDTIDDEKGSEEKTDLEVKEAPKEKEVITEGGNDPEVKKTIVNPAWEPVGTSQTGDHTAVYDGVDWDEMVQAMSYGTGIDQENMTILFLGNNGTNKSVGTIKQKDTQQEYRVYIEWVDGGGWKPTLIEELAE